MFRLLVKRSVLFLEYFDFPGVSFVAVEMVGLEKKEEGRAGWSEYKCLFFSGLYIKRYSARGLKSLYEIAAGDEDIANIRTYRICSYLCAYA